MQLSHLRIHEIVNVDGLPAYARGTAYFSNGRAYEFHANFAHGYGDDSVIILRKPPAPGPLHALAVARTLIARPERWAQGAIALDRRGRALVTFDGGCRFCAAGALGLASHVLTERPPDGKLAGSPFDQAERLLDSAAYALGEHQSYIGLNEHDSHTRVVAMFDLAVDMARADSAPKPEAS